VRLAYENHGTPSVVSNILLLTPLDRKHETGIVRLLKSNAGSVRGGSTHR